MRRVLIQMKNLKHLLLLSLGGLAVLNTTAADAPERPLHVLYIGAVNAGSGGRRFGDSRTNYVYLPGQTLAPEAIYFDHLTSITNLTDAYLKHFDAVALVAPETGITAPQQKLLDSFKNSGKALIKYTDGARPADSVLREAVLSGVSKESKAAWEAYIASRAPLKRQ